MRYGLDEYARMLVDPVRGAAYLAAVRETVRPGMVVADIGAGPGALGVYAATLGARRVFLVDPDLSVIAGRALAEENGVGDRVDIFRSISTETELPEAADVIISDLHMPVMDGRDATIELRRQGTKVPIIALTASIYADENKKVIACGADDIVIKPFEPESLRSKLMLHLKIAS